MVERFYCQLKAALMTRASNTWLLDLPIVLLGTCASLKVDLKCTMAELVYGTIDMTQVYDVTLECYTILLPL